jgi:hypothetical protein
MFEQLISGKRYLFIRGDKQYRANFIDIIGNTIRVDHCEFEEYPETMLCTPIEWIQNIQTLVSIMKDNESILPDEILLIVDEFL